MRADFKVLTLFSALAALGVAAGCSSGKTRAGVEDVPQCRQAANAVHPTEFDTQSSVLERRADAYVDCMQAHRYVLDQEEVERRLIHKAQVRNSDPLGGDPAYILARYRQQLRMDPGLWRPGPQ
jgi:hypothetical protein